MPDDKYQAGNNRSKKTLKNIASEFYSQQMNTNRNKMKNNDQADNSIRDKVKQSKTKDEAKKMISTVANAAGGPLAGEASKAALDTPIVDKMFDEEATKSDNPVTVAKNVAERVMNKKKNMTLFLQVAGVPLLIMLVVCIFFLVISKNADSQTYSSKGGNTEEVKTDKGIDEGVNANVFTKYEDLYLKVNEVAQRYHNEFGLELNRALIVATLVAPIENDYYGYGELREGASADTGNGSENIDWNKMIERMKSQVELLASYQIMEVYGSGKCDDLDGKDPQSLSMQEIAKHDLKEDIWDKLFGGWIYNSLQENERNRKCTSAESMGNKHVRVVSTEEGQYSVHDEDGEIIENKDETSGGVYFWNLVNPKGFIYSYYKDHLALNQAYDDEDNYKANLDRILNLVKYIYAYSRSQEENMSDKYCDNYRILEDATITEVNVAANPEKGTKGGTYPLEDYVAGVIAAEFQGPGDAGRAFAILARTYALSIVGKDGSGTIKNSSSNQNFDPKGINNPEIQKMVESTRGLVLAKNTYKKYNEDELKEMLLKYELIENEDEYTTSKASHLYESNYQKYNIFMTEYDAFCPTTSEPEGEFYWLTTGQNGLPISDGFVNDRMRRLAKCPCRSGGGYPEDIKVGYSTFLLHQANPEDIETRLPSPLYMNTTAPPDSREDGDYAKCWKYQRAECREVWDSTKKEWVKPSTCSPDEKDYYFNYKPSGGHGRGASQYGLAYFYQEGYDMEQLLKLFYDRGIESQPDKANGHGGRHVQIMRIKSSLSGNSCETSEELFPESPLYYSGEEVTATSNTSVVLRQTLETFLDARGSSIEEYRNLIQSKIDLAGRGTTEAVAEAAIAMISSLDQSYGIRLPFAYSGGQTVAEAFINGEWGGLAQCKSSGMISHTGSCVIGLNNSGFVNTLLYISGFKFNNYSANEWSKVGKKIDIKTCEAKKGDLIWHDGAVMIIVGKSENNSFFAAQSKNELSGIVIEEVPCNNAGIQSPNYIIDMSEYYAKNKR